MLKKLFRALSTGGVSLAILPPNTAGSAGGFLHVSVSLRNSTQEPRFVHDIEFSLRAKTAKDDDGLGAVSITHAHPLGVELLPGVQQDFSLEMPTRLPGGRALDAVGSRYGYVLTGVPRIEGFSVSRPRAVEFGKGAVIS